MIILNFLKRSRLAVFLSVTIFFGAGVSAFGQMQCMAVAREQYNDGNYTSAIKLLLGCPDEKINSSYTELLASAYFHSGDLAASHRLMQSVPDTPGTAGMLNLKARIAFARGDFRSSYKYYRILADSDSVNLNYIRQLAACSEKFDSVQQAISYYSKALELYPDDLVSGIRLASIYEAGDELLLADSVSAILLKIDSLPLLLRLRGDILYRMKEYQRAYECFEPLLAEGTSDADLLRKAGVCKFTNGETELAISMLAASHLIKPANEITCYYLGMAYYSAGDYKSSELYFMAAIKAGISQNLSNYYHRMADMYENSGNYSKALDALQSALKYREQTDTFRPELYGEIGRIYEVYLNDSKNAIRYYELFLEIYPDSSSHKFKSIKSRKEVLQGK